MKLKPIKSQIWVHIVDRTWDRIAVPVWAALQGGQG